MGTIDIHAGDFQRGKHSAFMVSTYSLAINELGWAGWKRVAITADQIEVLELASEENVKKLGGTVGWGIAGGLVLGPVGLLAGLLMGGRSKNVTFVAKFKDGRKFLGTTDAKTYTKMLAASFR